jgi:hypothetical protein
MGTLAQAIKAWALATTATATRNNSDPKLSLSMIRAEAELPPSL